MIFVWKKVERKYCVLVSLLKVSIHISALICLFVFIISPHSILVNKKVLRKHHGTRSYSIDIDIVRSFICVSFLEAKDCVCSHIFLSNARLYGLYILYFVSVCNNRGDTTFTVLPFHHLTTIHQY